MLAIDNTNELLYINVESGASRSQRYRGYRKDYLVRNLTELEDNYVVCPKCEGIMREAVDYSSIITCKLCSKSGIAKPIQKVKDSISKLEVRCPIQRDCGWKGLLSQAEQHLDTCECFLIKCPLKCEEVLMRSKIRNHKKYCPMREASCEHCQRTGKAKDLEKHWKECHKYPILCDCEDKIPREEIEEHNKECPKFPLLCPFEYLEDSDIECSEHLIIREDIPDHNEAEHVVHLDMLHKKVLMLEKRLFELELKVRCQKTLEGCEWELKGLFNNKENRESPEFYVHGYKLVIIARIYHMSECLDDSAYPKFTRFSLKRLRGDNDKLGVTDTITECRMVQINKDNPRESKFQSIPLDYKLDTEAESELFGLTDIPKSDNNLLFRFYFDINNTRLEDMKTCYEKAVKPIPTTF